MATFQATPALPGYIPEPSTGNKLLRLLSGGAFGKPFGAIERTNLSMAQNRDAENARVDAMLRMKKEEEDRAHAELVQRLMEGAPNMTPEQAQQQAALIMTMGKQAEMEASRNRANQLRGAGEGNAQYDLGKSLTAGDIKNAQLRSMQGDQQLARQSGVVLQDEPAIGRNLQGTQAESAQTGNINAGMERRSAQARQNAQEIVDPTTGANQYVTEASRKVFGNAVGYDANMAKLAADLLRSQAEQEAERNKAASAKAFAILKGPQAEAQSQYDAAKAAGFKASLHDTPHGATTVRFNPDTGELQQVVTPLMQTRPVIGNPNPEPAPSSVVTGLDGKPLSALNTHANNGDVPPEKVQALLNAFEARKAKFAP